MLSLIARPAASSAAVLTRKPLERRLKLFWSAPWFLWTFFWASRDETLVMM
jgi:hypothetical protein